MSTYSIEPIIPGMVKIHEEVVSYTMTRKDAEENLEVVKASRAKYPNDETYLRRLQFYQDVLDALDGKTQSPEAPL